MKSNVSLSAYSLTITLIVVGVLAVIAVVTFGCPLEFTIISALLLVLLISGLLYAPSRVYADEDHVTVKSILRRRNIPIKDIASIERFQPTMGAYRLIGSGGFMGYWGLFREGDIGRYHASYGKSSQCFLLRTKDGSQYVLGCDNPDEMVEYIRSKM